MTCYPTFLTRARACTFFFSFIFKKKLIAPFRFASLRSEWENERSGKDFSALKFLPENKTVVLGLVSSKVGTLEDKELLISKIKEAATLVPRGIEQLAISPQCGFSSTVHGNDITEEQQYAKLALCADVAEAVWGAK